MYLIRISGGDRFVGKLLQLVECQESTLTYVASTQPHFRVARASWITYSPLRYVGLQFYVAVDS